MKHLPVVLNRLCLALLAVLLVVLAGLAGNTQEPAVYGPSLASWLYRQWRLPGSQSGHGGLVLVISLWLVWRRRRELAAAAGPPARGALPLVLAALALYWAGVRTQQPRLGVLAVIAWLWSVPWRLWGRQVARRLAFPCAYLVFCVPLGFLAPLTLPLRLISCVAATGLLNGLGLYTVRRGTAILPGGPESGLALDVADPCSGLHSIIAMTALTALYAHLTQRTPWRQWILFLAAVPLAMAGNVARIMTLAVAARVFGTQTAMRLYHDFSGYLVFGTAIILLMLAGAGLNKLPFGRGGKVDDDDGGGGGGAAAPGSAARAASATARAAAAPLLAGLACLAAVHLAGPPARLEGPRLAAALPVNAGEWRGTDLLYCQAETCAGRFTTGEHAADSTCPRCGGPLDTVSPGEKRLLPPDTSILRRQYTGADGTRVAITIAVTGADRSSIHRPEWCLPGQGLSIRDSRVVDLPLRGRETPLRVSLLALAPQGARAAPSMVYAYWFVGRDRETPRHVERLFWMAWENLVHNRRYRWSYIAVATASRGDTRRDLRTLSRFLSDLYPLIDRPPAGADAADAR